MRNDRRSAFVVPPDERFEKTLQPRWENPREFGAAGLPDVNLIKRLDHHIGRRVSPLKNRIQIKIKNLRFETAWTSRATWLKPPGSGVALAMAEGHGTTTQAVRSASPSLAAWRPRSAGLSEPPESFELYRTQSWQPHL